MLLLPKKSTEQVGRNALTSFFSCSASLCQTQQEVNKQDILGDLGHQYHLQLGHRTWQRQTKTRSRVGSWLKEQRIIMKWKIRSLEKILEHLNYHFKKFLNYLVVNVETPIPYHQDRNITKIPELGRSGRQNLTKLPVSHVPSSILHPNSQHIAFICMVTSTSSLTSISQTTKRRK